MYSKVSLGNSFGHAHTPKVSFSLVQQDALLSSPSTHVTSLAFHCRTLPAQMAVCERMCFSICLSSETQRVSFYFIIDRVHLFILFTANKYAYDSQLFLGQYDIIQCFCFKTR